MSRPLVVLALGLALGLGAGLLMFVTMTGAGGASVAPPNLGLIVTVLALVVGGLAAFVLPVVAIIMLSNWWDRRAADALRASGTRCRAKVKSFRRISMTQHRVMLAIEFPDGPSGREYVLTGLSDQWLADVCALERPVEVIADRNATTVVFV